MMAVHPGSVLRSEIEERGISQRKLAEEIGMLPSHLNEIIRGKRRVTAQTADKLEAALGIPALDWLGLQNRYDYDIRRQEKERNAFHRDTKVPVRA